MRYFKWITLAVLVLLVGGFLHYTLPQHDVVRIVSIENRRIDFGANSWFWASPDTGSDAAVNRDVRFINTVRVAGKPMVYRNEDTGWGWPPYFKLDSSNLQTEAADLVSAKDTAQWAVVTHYGWRSEFFSIYPNAISLRPVDSPAPTIIPWFNIIFLIFVLLIMLGIFRMLQRFRKRRIDPVLEDVGEVWDKVEDGAAVAHGKATGVWGRFTGWLGTWRSK